MTNDIAAQVTTNQVGLWEDDRERRLLLGPSIVLDEEAVLDKLHGLYYDSDNDYERLRRIKKRWDPNHECGNRRRRTNEKRRGAVISRVFEGTSEIQQLVIERAISGLRIE